MAKSGHILRFHDGSEFTLVRLWITRVGGDESLAGDR
jgi:hypothetical protein